jgi:type I restriction enzyme S subunit
LTRPYPLVRIDAIKAPSRYSLVGGPFGSKLVSRDYRPDGVPVIRGVNLASEDRFSCGSFVFVSEKKVRADLFGNLAFPGDIVVTQRGTLGQVGLIPNSSIYRKFVISQSQMKLTVDPRKADPLFVYYALKSPLGQHEIHSRAITAGVPHINLASFQELRLPLPPLTVQRKIASILSAYDDLVANNSRRVVVLEELARRIYREWFVDFRYPGAAGVPLVQSELGLIPEGWKVTSLGDQYSVVVGATPSRKRPDYWSDGSISWINSGQINDLCVIEGTELITPAGFAATSTKMMPIGTALVAITGATLGQVSYLAISACGSQNVCGVYDPQGEAGAYLYFAVRESIDDIANRAMGGAQQHINRGIVRETLMLLPEPMLLSRFNALAGAMVTEMVNLLVASSQLRRARDLLLPRLISGEIEVDELNIEVPDLAA